MPGHMLNASCLCGYETGLSPGASMMTNSSTVIAYTADLSDLITIDEDLASKAKLKTIADPALDADPMERTPIMGDEFEKGWGPYLCPECKRKTLRIFFCGNWD